MRKLTKKRLLIVGIVFVVLIVAGIIAVNIAVNQMFAQVTRTISESDLLDGGKSLDLPAVDENSDVDATGETIELDADMIQQLETKVSMSDKFAVLSILAKALPSEEYSRLLSFLSGGVTQDELSQAMEILRENLSDEDKKQIKQYYAKYLNLLEN